MHFAVGWVQYSTCYNAKWDGLQETVFVLKTVVYRRNKGYEVTTLLVEC